MNNRSEAAFTLIEILITIVIITILTFSLHFIPLNQAVRLNAQAQKLISDIRYTQNLAMTRGIRYYLHITSTTTYSISDINGNNAANYNLGTGMTFGTLTNLPNSLITFDSQGTPYSDITLPGTQLAANASIALTASDGSTRTVTIIAATGEVSS